jgi:hypothetical protein
MRQTGILLLLAAAAWMAVRFLASTSLVGIYLVDFDGRLGIPIYSILGGLGVILVLASLRLPGKEAARQVHRRSAPAQVLAEGAGWRQSVIEAARALPLEPGTRLEVLPRAQVQLALVLEECPPEKARRAVGKVGAFIASIPRPPRLEVRFNRCPPGAGPRHHQVAGALSEHLDKAEFRVVSASEQVDVLFHQPDPRWLG